MRSYLEILAERVGAEHVVIDAGLDQALAELDRVMERLGMALEVEHVGPGVGMADMGAEHVYRLVMRRHRWDVFTESWGLKVCDALANCELRPMWPLQGTARLRKRQVVRVLPEFFAGYIRAVIEAGKSDTAAGRELRDIVGTLVPVGGRRPEASR
jgi:hypothetical protein